VVSAGLRAGGKDVFDGAINRNDLYISLTKIHRPYLTSSLHMFNSKQLHLPMATANSLNGSIFHKNPG